MNTPRLLQTLASALIAGGAGFYLGRQTGETPPPVSPAKVPASRTASPSTAQPAAFSGLPASLAPLSGVTVTPANATTLAIRALEEPDPATRMAASLLIVESMTPENAKAIYQAYIDSTTKTGRKHDGEWALMIRRYGAVLGAEALKDVKAEPFNVALALEGMAARDPAAALTALQETGLSGSQFTSAWLTGVCRKDPQQALTLALSGKYNDTDGGPLLAQAIHSLGIDGANAALQKALDTAPETAADSPILKGLVYSLGENLFHKNWTLGTPQETLVWLEQQKDEPYIPSGFFSRAVHENMAKGNVTGALDFIERTSAGRPTPRGAERLYTTAHENPSIIAGMSPADCTRLIKYLPPDPHALIELIEKVEPLNAGRAAQLRAALPGGGVAQ